MISKLNHQSFDAPRRSQSLRNDRCQNILYKAVFEHFREIKSVGALLLASKSFQNSSFGPNFTVNYIVDQNSIDLIESVLSPSSCFSLQFTPSLYITQSWVFTEEVNHSIANFVGEIVASKYLHLSLRSHTLERAHDEVISFFFGSSSGNSWPQLHDLTLENCDVEDDVVEIISTNAPQLRTLNFSKYSEISDVGLEHISKLANVTSFQLCSCRTITDTGMEHVSKLSGITSLDLRHCSPITDVGLQHVAKLTGITDLNLSFCDKITDAGLRHHVATLSRITALDLSGCNQITEVGLEHISTKLSLISDLNLGCCDKLSDAGMTHVGKLSNITSLNLSNCPQITDAGIEHLTNLSRITSLNLSCCYQLTDSCVQHVTKFSRITSLDLSFCDRITTEAKNKLKVALPHCDILGHVADN